MTITLKQANTIIDTIIKRGAEMNCRPISAVVVENGCIVKAFQKEDGASMSRFEMAYGKCYAALSLGRSSGLVKLRQQEKPEFVQFLIGASGDRLFAEGGGRLVRDKDGNVIDGSPDKVTDVTDVWTFARDLSSRDPNWKLVATEAGQ